MSDPKPVELTEAEREGLIEAIQDGTHDAYVARIITARVIAAEQAGREDNALHDMCYVSGSKALEAREAAARREGYRKGYRAAVSDQIALLTAALAEPERDEESGQ